MEGRKDERLIWILQESKHKRDIRYKTREIQLVSSLIATCRHNYNAFSGDMLPKVMYKIHVKADEVPIICIVFIKEYILSLFGITLFGSITVLCGIRPTWGARDVLCKRDNMKTT